MTKVITMMPVRLAATRLPNKPLLNINGKTLIQRVYENVEKALGEVKLNQKTVKETTEIVDLMKQFCCFDSENN